MASGKGSGFGSGSLGCFQIMHLIYVIFLFIAGLGCLGVGMWMAIDKDVKAYFVVFRRDPGDDLLVAGVGCFITVGLILLGIGVVGLLGAMKKNSLLLMLYVAALVIVFIIEVTIGFCVVKFRDDIHKNVKNSMEQQIKKEYTWDNEVGVSWNRIQVRNRCCGADGSWDYTDSNWFFSQNGGNKVIKEGSGSTDYSIYVPDSCCRLEYNQDRDPGKVDPQNPIPKDKPRCNEDAAGRKTDDNYLHGRGCFAAMLDFIYIHIDLVMGLGLAAGFMQIAGITFAGLLICALRDNEFEK